jgi:hypothetical protein
MKGGNVDYKSIKDKIDTDLLIDILGLSFETPTVSHSFINKTTHLEEPFATLETYVECAVAILECRVTIVDKGQLGGLFTLRTSPCDLVDYDFTIDGFRQNMAWVGREESGMFPVLRVTIESDQEKRMFTQALATQLINLLSSQ